MDDYLEEYKRFFKIDSKNKDYRIFLCYRANTAILARNFYDYIRKINVSLYDSRFFGDVYYSDYISCGRYVDYDSLKEIIDKVEYFVIFLDRDFCSGFLKDGKINDDCVTAHEIKYLLESNKNINIIVVNINGYNFKNEIDRELTNEKAEEYYKELRSSEEDIVNAIKKRLELESNIFSKIIDGNNKIEKVEKLTKGNNINNFDIRQGNEEGFFERIVGSIDSVDITEDVYLFGEYPQNNVSKGAKNLILADKANIINDNWKSYDYIINGQSSDFMKYHDFSINVNSDSYKVRGVFFDKYRPCLTDGLPFGYQEINGYPKNEYYFFKYDKIKWRKLYEDEDIIYLSSVNILDSQPFNNCMSEDIKPNDFETSTIKRWLNNDFINLAFSKEEIECLESFIEDDYKVSLLNELDVTVFLASAKRGKVEPTKYALAQGVYVYNGSCDWFLRDASNDSSFDAKFICGNKFDEVNEDLVTYTNGGIMPCIKIDKSFVKLTRKKNIITVTPKK